MKICRITPCFPPNEFGGSVIFASDISKALTDRGHQNIIITANPSRGDVFEENDKMKIYRFHPLNVSTLFNIGKESLVKQAVWTALDLYSYYSYKRIKEILIKERPDVVHIHTPIDMTLSAFDAVKSLRLPLVFTLHDYLLLCRRVTLLHASGQICTDQNINKLCKMYQWITKRIISNKVDIVTAPSQFILNIFKAHGLFNNTRTIVLPHGVKLSQLNTVSNEQKRHEDHKHGDVNILYVGGLTRNKGVHVLINAVKLMNRSNIKLHVVGDGVYEKELKAMATGFRNIIFYGNSPNNNMNAFYSTADLLVVPSIWSEVFGRVILEAFSVGLPVVCSDIGGMTELVKNNYNGFVFGVDNVEELKKTLLKIADNPNKLKELGANALKSAREYEFSRCVDRFIDVYREAIALNHEKMKC